MEARTTTSSVFFLADEQLVDFDVSLSPASSKGDESEDEVFVAQQSSVSQPEWASWSPLTGDQLDVICEEAQRVANQLQHAEPHRTGPELPLQHAEPHRTGPEPFLQDANAKLDFLGQRTTALSPIKRETFCVQDSPMKLLPPAIQRRLQGGNTASSTSTSSSTRPSTSSSARPSTTSSTKPSTSSSARPSTSSSSARPSTTSSARPSTSSSARPSTPSSARPSTSSSARPSTPSSTRPSTSSSARPTTSSSARPTTSSSTRPTSSPARPSTSSSDTKPRMALRGRSGFGVVLPSKLAVPSTSCQTRTERSRLQPPSKMASSRPSSRAGSCEDLLSDSVSDSSLNSSMLGKRMLAPPTKTVKNQSGVKAPPPQSRRVMERKNTSSSSSSASSASSSASPAASKLNSSLSRRLSGCPAPASRPANQSRPHRPVAAAEPPAGRRSLSLQSRRPSEAGRSTPLQRAEATPRTGSVSGSARRQSGLKSFIPPTPSGGVRAGRHGDGVSTPDVLKSVRPKRLMSLSGVDSLPQRPAGHVTPSAGGGGARRPSALPTPLRRRVSSIPVATPTRQPLPPPPSFSPTPTDTQEAEPVDIQPFSLEEEEEAPAAPAPTTPQPDQSESRDPGSPAQENQSESSKSLIELETTEEKKSEEVLLLDLTPPAPPALHPEEKLLIDLTNTPEPLRPASSKTCSSKQLIDLSSPLIKWSPEDKKENLINLSF